MPAKRKAKAKKSKTYAKKQPAKRARVIAPAMAPMRLPPVFQSLSKCGRHYVLAAADPFSPKAVGACVPAFPNRAADRKTLRLTGHFSAGTTGFAFVAVTPTLATEHGVVYHSSASFNQGLLDIKQPYIDDGKITRVTSGSTGYAESSMVPQSGHPTPGVSGRMVAAGLRIRYIGREDAKQGVIYGYVTSDHSNGNFLPVSSYSNKASCLHAPVCREWRSLSMIACRSEEIEYPQGRIYTREDASDDVRTKLRYTYPFSGGEYLYDTANSSAINNGGTPMFFCIQAGVGDKFEWEYVQHAEYIGHAVPVDDLGDSGESDSVAMDRAASAHAQGSDERSRVTTPGGFASRMADRVYGGAGNAY